MALAVDAVTSAVGAQVTTHTWAHTCSGANRGLVVGVSNYPLRTMTATYGGVAMLFEGKQSDPSGQPSEAQQFSLINPPLGANNIVLTWGGAATDIVAGAVSFTGANQTDLCGTQAKASANSATPSVNVASAAGEIVLDCLVAWAPAEVPAVGGGQTQRWNDTESSNVVDGAGSTSPGAASVTMSWSYPAARDWALVGISVRAAASTVYNQSISGALTFIGSYSRAARKITSGVLTSSGSAATARTFVKAVSGTLSFIGASIKRAGKGVAGAITFSGMLAKTAYKTLSGVLSGAGNTTKIAVRNIIGVLTTSGALAALALKARALDGVLTFAGGMSKNTSRLLSGALAFTGSTVKRIYKTLAGAMTSAGSAATARTFVKAVSGALSFFGNSAKRAGKGVVGAITFSGMLAKTAYKTLSGVLSGAGNTTKIAVRNIIGVLTTSGALAALALKARALDGVLTFAGGMSKNTSRLLSGALAFTGSTVKRIYKTLAGAMSFSGSNTLIRVFAHTLARLLASVHITAALAGNAKTRNALDAKIFTATPALTGKANIDN